MNISALQAVPAVPGRVWHKTELPTQAMAPNASTPITSNGPTTGPPPKANSLPQVARPIAETLPTVETAESADAEPRISSMLRALEHLAGIKISND